jgi:hypothetical protein
LRLGKAAQFQLGKKYWTPFILPAIDRLKEKGRQRDRETADYLSQQQELDDDEE